MNFTWNKDSIDFILEIMKENESKVFSSEDLFRNGFEQLNYFIFFSMNCSIGNWIAISAFQIKNKNNGPSFLKSFAFKSEFFQELWHVWQYFLLDWYPFMSFCGCLRHPMICTNWALWVVIKHCIYASKGDH